NVSQIDSIPTLDILQQDFNPKSEEYALIESRKSELNDNVLVDPRISSLVKMYSNLKQQYDALLEDYKVLANQLSDYKIESARKLSSMQRICANQSIMLNNRYQTVKAANNKLVKNQAHLQSKLHQTT